MIWTQLDKPEDRHDFRCLLCNKPMTVSYVWFGGDHPRAHWAQDRSVHVKCAEQRSSRPYGGKVVKDEVPERFREFDGNRCDQRTKDIATQFTPQSDKHILAVSGPPHRGKSRLVWVTIKGFFDQLRESSGKSAWVSYFTFVELIAEINRDAIARIKNDPFVFVDDLGCVDSFGRERGMLQAAIRARVQRNAWTFLTFDSATFDPDLLTQLKDRSTLIVLDQ